MPPPQQGAVPIVEAVPVSDALPVVQGQPVVGRPAAIAPSV